jgi:aryl-alcohol dehydrogenase-like predicted oxidoreductase
MEYRQLGNSGLKVPVLSFGTGTFAGKDEFFKAWGEIDVQEARRFVDICLEHDVTLFDTADMYSSGASEEILGQAIKGRRDKVMVATKATFRFEKGQNDVGSSRYHLLRSCENSLKRLGTDYIDLYQMHGFDAMTPVEETLKVLDHLVSSGKVRYIGCSNFSGWHLMKSLSVSERYGWEKYISYQGYYSLLHREYEWELMPLCVDQKIGTMIWSPLGWGRLTGKLHRGQPIPKVSRLHKTAKYGPPMDDDHMYNVIEAIEEVAKEVGKSVPQIAINWLLQRPTVANVIIGARNEEQLRDNLGAVGWNLTPKQVAKLDAASQVPLTYPYWHQYGFERNPFPVNLGSDSPWS